MVIIGFAKAAIRKTRAHMVRAPEANACMAESGMFRQAVWEQEGRNAAERLLGGANLVA